MNTGLQLKLLRKQHRYTQEEAAKILGISVRSISNYENNKTPLPISVMIKMAALYDFDVFTVFGVHDSSLVYDVPVYYYFKVHFEYVVRRERDNDIRFGNVLPEEYYDERLRSYITEYINDPIFIKNYPDAAEVAREDGIYNTPSSMRFQE